MFFIRNIFWICFLFWLVSSHEICSVSDQQITSNMSSTAITSIDIHPHKFSHEHLVAMRQEFPGLPDETLARFLIARNDNLKKAKEMLHHCVTWKAKHWPILKTTIGNDILPGKLYPHGVDKEGRPVLIWVSRKNKHKERDLEQTGRLIIWMTEYVIRKLMPNDKSKFTILIDRSHHGHENSDMELMKKTSSVFQNLYPERLHTCIIYPADFLFYTLWNIGKWFLDPVTRDKVRPVLTFAGVEEHIEKQYIPQAMGGSCTYDYHPDHFEEIYAADELESAANRPFEPIFHDNHHHEHH